MEKIPLSLPGAALCSPLVLAILAVCMAVLVTVVCADGTGNAFFSDWNVAQTGGAVHVDLPPPLVLPDDIPATARLRGDSTGRCPIGTNGAPQLLDPKMPSKALCRGACGSDCPWGRCSRIADITGVPSLDGSGTCTYKNVYSCHTDTGCQEHDACYDWCERNGYTVIADSCHVQCNQRCFDKYRTATCSRWADLPGKVPLIGGVGTVVADWMTTPRFDQKDLLFSDPPVFTPYKVTLTTLTTLPSSFPATTLTTNPASAPATIPVSSVIPSPPTTVHSITPGTTGGGPEQGVSLTVLYSGNGDGDVASDVKAALTCGTPQADGQSQCSAKYPYGTTVSLVALPHPGSRLVGWYGGCSGTGICTVVLNKDKTVTADFELVPETTPIRNYQDYCTENYPGSVYNPEEGTCEFHRPETIPTSGGGLNKPTLIPVAGECCPHEQCYTQVADAAGGTPPYHFSSGTFAGGGAPPMGLVVGLDGYLTGTAPDVGIYRFSVCVTDVAGNADCGTSTVEVS